MLLCQQSIPDMREGQIAKAHKYALKHINMCTHKDTEQHMMYVCLCVCSSTHSCLQSSPSPSSMHFIRKCMRIRNQRHAAMLADDSDSAGVQHLDGSMHVMQCFMGILNQQRLQTRGITCWGVRPKVMPWISVGTKLT